MRDHWCVPPKEIRLGQDVLNVIEDVMIRIWNVGGSLLGVPVPDQVPAPALIQAPVPAQVLIQVPAPAQAQAQALIQAPAPAQALGVVARTETLRVKHQVVVHPVMEDIVVK